MRFLILAFSLVVSLAATLVLWAWPNQPRPLRTIFPGNDAIASVSFAPYRADQDPIAGRYPSAAQIEADLKTIAGKVKQVRTYSSRDGLDVVPGLAARQGIKVMQGIWVNNDPKSTGAEIAGAVKLAEDFPDTVTAVIVGNEVLLRRDLPRDDLIAYIRLVKAQVKQPVTYADVWEFWLKNPQVADAVDFITVHFLPYWEDEPVGVDEAMAHIRRVYRTVKQAFPGKEILIGEVGWPSAGRSRQTAVTGRWEQVEFINGFLKLAAEEGFNYNLIEAFDQRWKMALEGIVGGRWGLWDEDRQPKFDLNGPVVEHPAWRLAAGLTVVLALAGIVLWRRRLSAIPTARAAAAIWLIVAVALMLSHQALRLWEGNIYNAQNWPVWSYLRVPLQWVLAWALIETTLQGLDGSTLRQPWRTFGALWTGRDGLDRRQLFFDRIYFVSVITAGWLTVMLAIAGRYRDFPVDDFWVATLGFAFARLLLVASGRIRFGIGALTWSGERPKSLEPRINVNAEAALGVTIVVAVCGLLAREHLDNREAVAWAGLALLLAVPQLATVWAARRG